MKKITIILVLQFFIVTLFAQSAAQISLSMMNSNGIREIDKELRRYKVENELESINDAELITNFQQFSLSFIHENQLYVLAYDKFDEIPLTTRGVYLFRKDSDEWHVASKRIFTSTYVENKLIDEFMINPSNTNSCIEIFDKDKIFMLIKNRIWVSDLKTNLGYTTTYSIFIILSPQPNGYFKSQIFIPSNMFEFFPETESYEITKGENFIKISSGNKYVKFMFDGEKIWESNPNNLVYYK